MVGESTEIWQFFNHDPLGELSERSSSISGDYQDSTDFDKFTNWWCFERRRYVGIVDGRKRIE